MSTGYGSKPLPCLGNCKRFVITWLSSEKAFKVEISMHILLRLSIFAMTVLILLFGENLSKNYHLPDYIFELVAVIPCVAAVLFCHKRKIDKVS